MKRIEDFMKVTVIIPNYNGKHFLKPCLESLSKQSCRGFDILIVDNHSTDGSVEFLKEHYPEAGLIVLEKNRGFSAAVNAGIRNTSAPYVSPQVSQDFFCQQQDDPDASSGTHRQCRRSVYPSRMGGVQRGRTPGQQLYGKQ